MKFIKRLMSLLLVGVLLMASALTVFAVSDDGDSITQKDLEQALTTSVPDILAAFLDDNTDMSPEKEAEFYLGTPFFIANLNEKLSVEKKSPNIVYFPICYKETAVAILTVYKFEEAVSCSVGRDFALKINALFLNNPNNEVALVAMDTNIYSVSESSFLPLQINRPDRQAFYVPNSGSYVQTRGGFTNRLTKESLLQPNGLMVANILAYRPGMMSSFDNNAEFSNYPIVYQGNNELCWAASVASMVHYLSPCQYGNLTAMQVADRMGIDYNRGGSLLVSKNALKQYLPNYAPSMKFRKLKKAEVKNEINSGLPAFLALRAGNYGHAVALYGYQDWPTSFLIQIMEPNNGKKVLHMTDSDVESLVLGNLQFKWTDTICLS